MQCWVDYLCTDRKGECVPYGMTAGHVVEELLGSSQETVASRDGEGDLNHDESGSGITPSMLSYFLDLSVDELPLGNVRRMSRPDRSKYLDWSLIKFDESQRPRPNRLWAETGAARTPNEEIFLPYSSEFSGLRSSTRSVIWVTGSQRLNYGRLSAVPTSIFNSPGEEFVDAFLLTQGKGVGKFAHLSQIDVILIGL